MQLLVTLIEAYENNDIIDYRSSNGPHQVPGGDWVVSAVDPEDAAFGVVGQQGAST
ncbi:MAG: hypothetical protein WB440_09630 [Steroidobacteraceae bacterium]|jgi:hypothetical protein